MKKFQLCALAIILPFLSFPTLAGVIADTFSEGVFGVNWGDSQEDVQEVFPDSESENIAGMIFIIVRDGREVLDIPRNGDDKIMFSFDANNRLVGVSVYFPQRGILAEVEDGQLSDSEIFTKLLSKLTTLFGRHESKPIADTVISQEADIRDFDIYMSSVVVNYTWPDNGGVGIALANYTSTNVMPSGLFGVKAENTQELIFTISVPSASQRIDKKQLGFE